MMNQTKNKFSDLENIIGRPFNDKELLEQVFVHRSYLNEHPGFKLSSNERLEFLGDAVLELVVTENIYKAYDKNEGELTSLRSALVKGKNLAKVARKLNLSKYLLLSKGEEKNQGRDNDLLLANTFEALVGALYLDLGFDKTMDFIELQVLNSLDAILKNELYVDAKSQLQEIYQAKRNITPTYKVLKESGPDHAKKFIVGVYLNKQKLAQGLGASKQLAQTEAARQALLKIN
ncbi:ribonuclease III [Patescibacteria group bacterium]